jgi:hypothetical protein
VAASRSSSLVPRGRGLIGADYKRSFTFRLISKCTFIYDPRRYRKEVA